MSVDIKKLEVQLQDNHDHTTTLLQTILETIDQIVEENKLQGEDIAHNTKAVKLMEVEIEEMRRKLDKQGERVENAAEAGANSAVKESLPKAVASAIEPRKFKIKTSRFRFWK
jgi:hypothetical protein